MPRIGFGHNHASIAGSRYFSPYFCLTGRNLTLPVDSKILKSKHSGKTEVDEYVRKLLPNFDHIRKLTKLNVEDLKLNYKRKYDEKYKTRPTQLKVGDYVYIEQKRLKIGDSAHITPNFGGPFMISEKVGRTSLKVNHCDTMKELPSPVHAERMKVAPFGSLERISTEKPIFGSDASEPSEAVKEKPEITGYRHRETTDQTVIETADVESEDWGGGRRSDPSRCCYTDH